MSVLVIEGTYRVIGAQADGDVLFPADAMEGKEETWHERELAPM